MTEVDCVWMNSSFAELLGTGSDLRVKCLARPVVRSLDFHIKCSQFFNLFSVLLVKGSVLVLSVRYPLELKGERQAQP